MKRRKRTYSRGGRTVPSVAPRRKGPLMEERLMPDLPLLPNDPQGESVNDAIRRLYMSQHPGLRRRRVKNREKEGPEQKNKGGAIGTIAGAGLGSIVPGIGTSVGASLGGAAGSIIGGLFGSKEEEEPEPPATVGRVFQSSYGFREGGSASGEWVDMVSRPPERFMPDLIPKTFPFPADKTEVDMDDFQLVEPQPERVEPASGQQSWGETGFFEKGGSTKRRSNIISMPVRSSAGSQPVRGTVQSQPVRGTAQSRPVRGTVKSNKVRSRKLQEGGPVSMNIGGRSHEAGGVNLSEFGRPDIEVERGESILFDSMGEPEYVFSALNMDDKARTFAEEFNRLKEKGDLAGIRNLKKKQEEQMGRKTNVTMDSSLRQANYAKHGGSLKYRKGGSTDGYNPKKAAYRYAGKVRHMPTGGFMDPPRTFYSAPGGQTTTQLPPQQRAPGRVFTPGPGGTGISGPPSGPVGRNLPSGPVGRNLPVPYSAPRAAIPWGPIGTGVTLGYTLGEMATPGRTLYGEMQRAGEGQRSLARSRDRRRDFADQRDATSREVSDWHYQQTRQPNVAPEDVIMDEDIQLDELDSMREPGIARRDVAGATIAGNPPGIQAPEPELATLSPEAVSASTSFGDGQAEEGGRNWLQTASNVAPYVADLFNIGVAATMQEPERPRGVTPALMDTRVSTTADEEMLTQQARTILGNPNASSGERLAAMAQLHRGRGQVRGQARGQSQQIERGNVQAINRAREINQRVGERHSDRVAQFRGARASAIAGGVSSIAGRIERRGAEQRMTEMEPMQLTALMHSMPTADRRDMIQDLIASLPEGHRTRRQLEMMLNRDS